MKKTTKDFIKSTTLTAIVMALLICLIYIGCEKKLKSKEYEYYLRGEIISIDENFAIAETENGRKIKIKNKNYNKYDEVIFIMGKSSKDESQHKIIKFFVEG